MSRYGKDALDTFVEIYIFCLNITICVLQFLEWPHTIKSNNMKLNKNIFLNIELGFQALVEHCTW